MASKSPASNRSLPRKTSLCNESSCIQAIYNPFEMDICSLSLPTCSPDVCSLTKKSQETDCDNSFRWSIGQVSLLRPAEIDEDSHQTTLDRWDEEKETKAQKAIETFFLHNSVCPSPWNGPVTFNQVTFSPHLASTAYYSRSSSHVFRDSNCSQSSGKKDVWTQTTLAIPLDVDIFELLGHFYTFLESQRNQKLSESDSSNDAKDVGNSSLRRKLFSPNRFQKQDHCSALPLSPLKFCTPEKHLQYKYRPVPSSTGTHLSSSPIFDKKFSISPGSGDQNWPSPVVSPILTEKQKSSAREMEKDAQLKFLPSTPNTKKGNSFRLSGRSLDTEEFNQSTSRGRAVALSLSMASKDSNEEHSNAEELQMEADKLDSTGNSEMQVSVVQYSCDERTTASQDTGYKTESYQHSLENRVMLDGISASSGVSLQKRREQSSWLCQDHLVVDSVNEESDPIPSCAGTEVVDSVLVSQSTWMPHIFSTPH